MEAIFSVSIQGTKWICVVCISVAHPPYMESKRSAYKFVRKCKFYRLHINIYLAIRVYSEIFFFRTFLLERKLYLRVPNLCLCIHIFTAERLSYIINRLVTDSLVKKKN